jgi:hypothetical protein
LLFSASEAFLWCPPATKSGQSVGLQTGTTSADYIQLWHGDANLLRESLEAVQQTAAVILGGIAPEAGSHFRPDNQSFDVPRISVSASWLTAGL